ncbi:hypothetical protein D3C71_1445870 [compost metagenome]
MRFGFIKQAAGDATAAEVGVDQQLADLGPMRLIGRRVAVQLHGAGQPAALARDPQRQTALQHRWQYFCPPEGSGVVRRKRQDEADAGPIPHAGVQQAAQFGQAEFCGVGRQQGHFKAVVVLGHGGLRR